MATSRLLLLLVVVVVASQSVDGQGNETTSAANTTGLPSITTTSPTTTAAANTTGSPSTTTTSPTTTSGQPRDCAELYNSGERSDGVYTVYIGCDQRPVEVYCDMTTDDGGWTVFQRRKDGTVDFYRNWTHYKTGFGDPSGEFWLGNDNIHAMTFDKAQRLRIDLADFRGYSRYAEYSNFIVDFEGRNYTLLSLGEYSGTAGDSMTKMHLGMQFSTPDQDNDRISKYSCAQRYKGAWWYNACHWSNLNGQYLNGTHRSYGDGVNWRKWRGYKYSLKFTEMKIKGIDE